MTNEFGCAKPAGKNGYYVLAKMRKNREAYWNGEIRQTGRPSFTMYADKALLFSSAKKAYSTASHYPALSWHRAVPLHYKENGDGFVSRWWCDEEV